MDNRFRHPFHAVASEFRNMRRKLPAEISNIAVDEFKGNFRVGGYRGDNGTTFWEDRKPNTWGKPGNTRRNRALLVKSGRLKRGIVPRPTFDSARVINNVPYAKAHNFGFKGTVSQKVRRFQRRGKNGGTHTVRPFIRKIEMNLVARPFMLAGKPLYNNINNHILNRLVELWANI